MGGKGERKVHSQSQKHHDIPLYSMPHLSLMKTGLPVRPCRKGLGFTSTYKVIECEWGVGRRERGRIVCC